MYLVREVVRTKPGKTKELVKKFKQTVPYMEKAGMKGLRIMTDIAAAYWTVIIEFETDDLTAFAKDTRSATMDPEVGKIMEGYHDIVLEGYREIFLIE